MIRRAAFLATMLTCAAWAQACGSDDEATIAPPEDAGAEGGFDANRDTSPPPPPVDAGTDATSSDADADAAADAAFEGGTTLDGGVCDGGSIAVTGVTPKFGTTGASTSVTVTGSGFIATPRAYLLDAAKNATELASVAFVSTTSITASAPSGLAAGTYDVAVVNPDDCAGTVAGAFKVVANPAPLVLSVSPAQGTTQNDVDVTITGCFFQNNATLQTVNETGTVVEHDETAPVAGANDPRCNNGPLYTMTGKILTKSAPLTAGAYLVRVTNPTDATYGEYAAFIVSNPSGNLTGGWKAAASLVTGRRSLAVASARIDDQNRFLYAIGGENSGGTALKTVEVAQVDRFGKLGAWTVQKNELKVARSGLAVVQRGLYLYAIAGTSSTSGTAGANATDPSGTPLGSIERAKVLLSSGAPGLADPAPSTASGTLAKGTFYYRVSAVLDATDPATEGETLASKEVVALLTGTGQVALTWTAPAVGSVAHYRVYRSPAANGASGSEVLLKDNVAGTSYTDTGADAAGTEKPMALGSTGPWITSGSTLVRDRLNTAATIAPDPNGALHVYVIGGYGKCTGAGASAIMTCFEYASLSADGATLGAFTAGTNALARSRMRHGADAMTAANGPSTFATNAGATTAFVLVSGGKGNSTGANTVEYALVTAGGNLGAWASPGGFSNERDGSRLFVASGYGYAFQGGTAANAYSVSTDQSALATVTATTLTFSNWSNAAANLGTKLGRHGVGAESAYFYIIGGTTNDTDALTTVQQVLH